MSLAQDDQAASSSEATESPAFSGGRLARLVAWCGVGALLLVWLAHLSAPGTASGHFNSDSGIPLLMANAERVNPFFLFYLGQDRFGGWPFLAGWAVQRLAGWRWSPEALHLVLVGALLSAAWPLRALAGRWGTALAAAFVSSLVLVPLVRANVLDISQPYAWQIAAILFAWWGTRRFVALRGWRFAGASLAWLLALWMSPLSAVFLVVIVAAEVARDRALGGTSSVRRLVGLHLTPALVALVPSLVLQRTHAWYAKQEQLFFQRSKIVLDAEHWGANLSAQVQVVLRSGWWWAALASLVGGALLTWAVRRRPQARGLVELWSTTLAFAAMGWACFVVNVAISWPRLNGYSARYMAPALLFWAIATAASVLGLLEWKSLGVRWHVAATAAFLALVGIAPQEGANAHYGPLLRAAHALEAKAPAGAFLLGGYWDAYALASLQRVRPVVPVVGENAMARLAWTSRQLADATEVIVSHSEAGLYGSAEAPAPVVVQYGVLLALVTPRWLVEGPYAFSLYRNVSREATQGMQVRLKGQTLVAAQGRWPNAPLGGSPLLEVSFPPRAAGTLTLEYAAFWSKSDAAAVRYEAVGVDGTIVPIDQAQTTERQLRLALPQRDGQWSGVRLVPNGTPPPGFATPHFRAAFVTD